jgi:hypothetical protein
MDLPSLADPPNARRRGFQFTVRTLFIFSLIVALFLAAIFSKYDAIRSYSIIVWLIYYPSTLLAVAIYGHGYLRSYCLGAFSSLFPLSIPGILLLVSIVDPPAQLEFSDFSKISTYEDTGFFIPAIFILLIVLASSVGGLSVMLTRWMIDSTNQHRLTDPPAAPDPPPATPM